MKGWQGIPLDQVRKLREEGNLIYIVGAYDLLLHATDEFPNGWHGEDKISSLKKLAEKHPDVGMKVYIGDRDWDKYAAEQAGWSFVFWDQFASFLEYINNYSATK